MWKKSNSRDKNIEKTVNEIIQIIKMPNNILRIMKAAINLYSIHK